MIVDKVFQMEPQNGPTLKFMIFFPSSLSVSYTHNMQVHQCDQTLHQSLFRNGPTNKNSPFSPGRHL